MIGLDLSTSLKSAAEWIIITWYQVLSLILDSIWIILVFYCKFCAFKIILFYTAYFWFFYPEINKLNIYNNIVNIPSFQNVLNDLFNSTGFYLKSKVVEGSHKGKICFLIFGYFFSKYAFLACDIFCLFSVYPINSIFQWYYVFIRFAILVKHFSS